MRHLTNFLPELGRQDANREYVVLVRESFPVLATAKHIRLERVPDRACSSWVRRLTRDVVELPRRLKREKFSAVVSLTNFGPIWSSVPHVFFQRDSRYYCPYHLAQIAGIEKMEIALRRRLAVESMKRADLIVTPSHSMGEMIKEMCPETRNRNFKTLYHGFEVNRSYGITDGVLPQAAHDAWPLLFFPSHLGEHKGFRFLFDVVSILIRRFPRLKLLLTIGQEDDPKLFASSQRYMGQLGITQHVLMIGRVPQNAIFGLYKKSDLMVYPALCESFGFAFIEAMGARLPIVAPDTNLAHEICGTAAKYFPPLCPEACAEQIDTLLDDAVARSTLRSECARRFTDYDWSWRRYASEFASILNEFDL